MSIGYRIMKLRKKKGISQDILAQHLGVTRQSISRWELDQSVPDIVVLSKIADYFEVSINYVVEGKENEKRKVSYVPIMVALLINGLIIYGLIGVIKKTELTKVLARIGQVETELRDLKEIMLNTSEDNSKYLRYSRIDIKSINYPKGIVVLDVEVEPLVVSDNIKLFISVEDSKVELQQTEDFIFNAIFETKISSLESLKLQLMYDDKAVVLAINDFQNVYKESLYRGDITSISSVGNWVPRVNITYPRFVDESYEKRIVLYESNSNRIKTMTYGDYSLESVSIQLCDASNTVLETTKNLIEFLFIDELTNKPYIESPYAFTTNLVNNTRYSYVVWFEDSYGNSYQAYKLNVIYKDNSLHFDN